MRYVTQIWDAFFNALEGPLLLAAVVALLIAAFRLGRKCWFLTRRGRRPLVMQVEYGEGGTSDGVSFGALDAQLLSYLSFDDLGGYVIAPGADGAAAPGVPAESQEPTSALLRIAFPAEPAYRVDVTWPEAGQRGDTLQATVRISKVPGERIVASRSFTGDSTDALVEAIGSYCVVFLLSQPSIMRATPRWERWNQDYTGYLHYRRGLDIERREGDRTTSLKAYREALRHYELAARVDPANMLVQLHRGTLLELTGAHAEAVALYQKCFRLWPEHVEVLYRLSTSYREVASGATFAQITAPIHMLRQQLSYQHLARAWLRTWRPGQWNPGERAYWRSWIRLRPWDRVSRRTAYLRAVDVAELVLELSFLIPNHNGRDKSGLLPGPAGKEKVTKLLDGLATLLLYPDDRTDDRTDGRTAADRMLRPAKAKPQPQVVADPAFIPVYAGRYYRRRATGWLAMFNAACFFSLAIRLPPEYLPKAFTPEEWRHRCAQASIHELGRIHRDPRNALDPSWIANDPDLQPLRGTDIGKNWMDFIGLRPSAPESTSPLTRSIRHMPRPGPVHGWPWRAPQRKPAGNGNRADPPGR